MEFKLKSGKKIKLKDVSIDERDEMLDSVEYQYDAKGNPKFNFKDRISGTVYKNYSMDRLEKLLNKKIK